MRREEFTVGRLIRSGSSNGAVTVLETDETGLVSKCKCATGSIPSAVAGYAIGCQLIDTTTGKLYYNSNTATSCTFNSIADITSAELADSIDLGASGTAGDIDIFPATASKGKINIAATNNTNDSILAITNAAQDTAGAATRTMTIPNTGADASFVMTKGAQSIDGVKTFSSGLILTKAALTTKIGDWVGSGASGSAVPFSGTMNIYSDGQLDILGVYGESTTDLTNAYSAKCGRFRHLVVGTSLQVNHETYGLVGQLVGKSTSLLHMHAGLMGTLEANTTAVEANGAYAYSVAAVIARIGGTNLITATKPVCGFSAVHNGAALAGGSSVAYGACAVSTGNWTYMLAADNCDNLLYVATGSAYECGVKVATQLNGNAYPKMDGVIRMYVGGTDYYIPFYAAGNIDNE